MEKFCTANEKKFVENKTKCFPKTVDNSITLLVTLIDEIIISNQRTRKNL